MKRFTFIIMAIWNLLFGNATEQINWANQARYAQANRELTAHGSQVYTVLMGNSITEFWEEMHPQFFACHQLVGRGIGGQVSSQMLVRFRQDVINLKPQVVVINCGTNDIAENMGPYNEAITLDNITSMAELATANGITVVLSSVLPCDQFCWNPSIKEAVAKIQSLNQHIEGYAIAHGMYYINYYQAMVGEHGEMNPAFTHDGVHPNSAGYDVMEQLLLNALSSVGTQNQSGITSTKTIQ